MGVYRGNSQRASSRRFSVRFRILIAILVVAAIGLAGSGTASYLVQRQRALDSVDSQLSRVLPELKAIASGQSAGARPSSVEDVLRAAMQQIVPPADTSVLGFIDFSPALVPAAQRPFRLEKDPALLKRLVSEGNGKSVVVGTAKSSAGTLRYAIVPVNVAGDAHTGMYVSAVNLDSVLRGVAQSFQVFALVALIALALIGIVSWFVAGRLLQPIRTLRDAAESNSGSNLSARIPVTGRDDLSELTATINRMFGRLENSFNTQQRLINDVRHELKTPITIIRGNLELLDPSNDADIDATRILALDELSRMSQMVSELSLLAEAQTPNFVELGPIDVDELTESVAAKARLLDTGRAWPVESNVTGTWLVDRRRVTQAWLQLADNAAKYSTPGAPIIIGSGIVDTGGGARLYLWVRDGGPGIPTEFHERIFERFGRLESNRGTEGSGLGLAIVAAIAEAHGGTVGLASEWGRESIFSIQLPVGKLTRNPRGTGGDIDEDIDR